MANNFTKLFQKFKPKSKSSSTSSDLNASVVSSGSDSSVIQSMEPLTQSSPDKLPNKPPPPVAKRQLPLAPPNRYEDVALQPVSQCSVVKSASHLYCLLSKLPFQRTMYFS